MQPTLALLLLVLVCGRYASGQLHHERTYEPGPHHVSLRINAYHYCGGTIVDDRWILTAAQCYSKENLTVLVGMNNLKTNGTSYLIDRFIVHSRFNQKKIAISHNIALIRLASPLVYNKFVEKIEISDKFVSDNTALTSVGTNHTNTTIQSTKIVKVFPLEECMRKYYKTMLGPFFKAGILCTINPVNGRSTSGPTGSGLTREGNLVGVFAGYYTFMHWFPNANARVSYYHDWIQTTIANNREEKAVPYRPSVRN